MKGKTTMEQNDRFTFFRSYYEAMRRMEPTLKGAFAEALCAFAFDGEEPGEGSPVAPFFALVRPHLEESIRLLNARRDAGRRGGEANGKQAESKREANGKQTRSKRKANDKQAGANDKHDGSLLGVCLKRIRNKEYRNIEYIPPKSPKGDCGGKANESSATRPDGSDGGGREARARRAAEAAQLAAEVEAGEAFAHARVNRATLRKCLASCLKKDGAAAIRAGLAAWTAAWKAEGWRYVPGRLTDWLYDGKYLEAPRHKDAPREPGLGEVGVSEIV